MKDFSILMMGYFADNYDECYKITQTDTFKGWTDSLSKDHGIKILSFTFYDGPRHFMTNKPINTPDDLKGMRIRTIGQEVCTETIQVHGRHSDFHVMGRGIQRNPVQGTGGLRGTEHIYISIQTV